MAASEVKRVPREAERYRYQHASLGSFGEHGSRDREFFYPSGIALDEDYGLLYVADTFNNRVQVFQASDGVFQFKFGGYGSGSGQLNHPHALLFETASRELWVTDRCNHRIQVFQADGTFLRSLGGPGSEEGRFNCPSAMAFDRSRDMLFVSDEGNNRVQVLQASSGTFLFQLQLPDTETFDRPTAVAVDGVTDRVFVSDKWGPVRIFRASTGQFCSRISIGSSSSLVFEERLGVLFASQADGSLCAYRSLPDTSMVCCFYPTPTPTPPFGKIYQMAVHASTRTVFIAVCQHHRISVCQLIIDLFSYSR